MCGPCLLLSIVKGPWLPDDNEARLACRQLGEPAFHLPLTHPVQQCPIDLSLAAAQGQDQLGMEEPAPGGLA